MGVKDTGTEQLIKDTAKRIFFAEGKFHATTQDIAEAAGIGRTVINYYFRSKDILFQQVFEEAMEDTHQKFNEVLSSKLPFKEKVIKFIDVFSADLVEYPFKESFLISEINLHGFVLPKKNSSQVLDNFFTEIKQASDKGIIKKMMPLNFMLNLFSLIVYPFITRPLFKELLEINDLKFESLMYERKKMIIEVLFL